MTPNPETHARIIVETLGEHRDMAAEITRANATAKPPAERDYWLAVHAWVCRLVGASNEWDDA